MSRPRQTSTKDQTPAKHQTPTFLLELPLLVTPGQAKRIRAHLEAAPQVYNAVLSEGHRRVRRMRADPAWQAARAIPRAQKLDRQRAFAALRAQYGFSEYALHEVAKGLNGAWIADHLDAVLAQTLATRAYRAQSLGVSGPGPAGAGRVAEGAGSPAWKTSARIPGCASCSSGLRRATPGICCGRMTGCPH